MFEYHGWVCLRDSAGCDDEEVSKATVAAVEEVLHGSSSSVYLADVRWMNGSAFVTLAGLPNHATVDVVEVYRRIASLAPGSYGLLNVHDDEAAGNNDASTPDDNNRWITYVMTRGSIRQEADVFLSPHIPTVEDDCGDLQRSGADGAQP